MIRMILQKIYKVLLKNGIIWEENNEIRSSIMQGFVEKCKVLLKDSQKSQNWKIDSDPQVIRIPKSKILW